MYLRSDLKLNEKCVICVCAQLFQSNSLQHLSSVKCKKYSGFCSAGHGNNIHCLAKAINSLAGALFTVLGHGDVEIRLKEFLAVSQKVTQL